MLLLTIAILLSACNRDNNLKNRNVTFQSAKSDFLGDPSRASVDYYDLYLYDNNLTSNPNGDGTYAYIQLNTQTTNVNEIIPGSYQANNSTGALAFTYEIGSWKTDTQGRYVSGSYIGTYVNGQLQQYPITNGKITVSQNGNYYTVSGIVTADGNQYNLSYQGQIEFSDMVVPLPNTLTHGEIWYQGDPYGNGVKIYTIRLGADNVKISDFSGGGDAMQIEVYTPLTATTIIPDGTYPVVKNKVMVNTAIDGYYDTTDKADYGTWYYTADALSIDQGSVKITYLTGSTYRLEFNFTDDYYGYNFSGTYEGELAFVNKTTSPIAVRSAVRSVTGTTSTQTSITTSTRGRNDRASGSRTERQFERRQQAPLQQSVRAIRK
ncbi:MAG: hypothetical protein ACYC2P_01585 [Paludibacteraceae bacterium]